MDLVDQTYSQGSMLYGKICAHCNLKISLAPHKAKQWEPAFSQTLSQNKIVWPARSGSVPGEDANTRHTDSWTAISNAKTQVTEFMMCITAEPRKPENSCI